MEALEKKATEYVPVVLERAGDDRVTVTSVVFNADGSAAMYLRYSGRVADMPYVYGNVPMERFSMYIEDADDRHYHYIFKAAS
jgi:hypothetical protein